MAGPTREQVYGALFTLAQTAAVFRTTGRRLRLPPNIGVGDMPAIFQVQTLESARSLRNQPTIWTLSVDLIIMQDVSDPNEVPAAIFNPMLDALQDALAADPLSNVQTLGGLVEHCWIEGDVEIFDGSLTNIAICVVPVKILVPGLV